MAEPAAPGLGVSAATRDQAQQGDMVARPEQVNGLPIHCLSIHHGNCVVYIVNAMLTTIANSIASELHSQNFLISIYHCAQYLHW